MVQKYITKPLLIDGFKFDLRLYVLINGINPLRIYLWKDGLARFATVPYKMPDSSNIKDLCMHLTNYAINKDSWWYKNSFDDSKGSKRSYTAVLRLLRQSFGDEAIDKMQ